MFSDKLNKKDYYPCPIDDKQTNEEYTLSENDFYKVFVVNGQPEGYFRLYMNDGENFIADIITSKAYEHCYEEIVAYIQNYLKTKTTQRLFLFYPNLSLISLL